MATIALIEEVASGGRIFNLTVVSTHAQGKRALARRTTICRWAAQKAWQRLSSNMTNELPLLNGDDFYGVMVEALEYKVQRGLCVKIRAISNSFYSSSVDGLAK